MSDEKDKPPHHLLDLRDPYYGYQAGWCDKVELLFIAPFRILCLFLEQEVDAIPLTNRVDWRATASHAHDMHEMRALHHWWTVDRPNREKRLHDLMASADDPIFTPLPDGDYLYETTDRSKDIFDQARELRNQYDKEDEIMIRRLYAVRKMLWT